MTGIYRITCTETGKHYVGSSVCMSERWACHRSTLRRGTHSNKHLQDAWRVHGEGAFEFVVIEECCKEYLIGREQYYVDTLRPEFNGTPICWPNFLGGKHTDEAKQKMRLAKLGKKCSEEHRRHMSESRKGRKVRVSASFHAHMVARNKSAEHRAKMKLARSRQVPPMLGRTHTDETRRIMSEKRKGWKPSGETLARMSEGQCRRRENARKPREVAQSCA